MGDLTFISTFGWYGDTAVTDDLDPISTFGWFFTEDVIVVDDAGDIVGFNFQLHRTQEFCLEI